MELHELPFAKIIILRDDIAEVIINEGVEMDVDMVKQYHELLITHLTSPFSLLINKINPYTYSFDAQVLLATLNEINVMAVVVYNQITKVSTKYLSALPRDKKWNLEIFYSRDEALAWLENKQRHLKD